MMSFRNNRLEQLVLPMSTVRLLNDIAEARGRHELFMRQSASVLEPLQEQALLQSVEAANRIGGVTVPADRLQRLVLWQSWPRDRSEQDALGYRLALQEIHRRHARLPIAPEVLRRVHALCRSGSDDAGRFRRGPQRVIQLVEGGPPTMRFRYAPAKAAAAVAELCRLYQQTVEKQQVPVLIAVGALVLDFLCIHPFGEGNGRMAHLLTLLALYRHGYQLGRYVSLERLIAQLKPDYYEALRHSAQRWHEARHDLTRWLDLFLGVLRSAYIEFERRAHKVCSLHGAKTRLVKEAIASISGDFTLTELERLCPTVSRDLIRWVIRNLRAQGRLQCLGRGPGAKWRKKRNILAKA